MCACVCVFTHTISDSTVIRSSHLRPTLPPSRRDAGDTAESGTPAGDPAQPWAQGSAASSPPPQTGRQVTAGLGSGAPSSQRGHCPATHVDHEPGSFSHLSGTHVPVILR